MRSTLLTATLLSMGLQSTFPGLGSDQDFVRPATRYRKQGSAESWGIAGWHSHYGPNSFSSDRIPTHILTEAETWIRRMVQGNLLPTDLRSRLKGCRHDRQDVVYARYRAPEGAYLQISENEVAVAVTYKDANVANILDQAASREFVRSQLAKCLRLTPDQLSDTVIEYRRWPEPLPSGFCRAQIRIHDQGLDREQMGWWNQIDYQSDGESIVFTLRKWLPGDHSLNAAGSSHQPYVGRFDRPGQ